MISTVAAILGLSYAGASILSYIVLVVATLLLAFGATHLYNYVYDVTTNTVQGRMSAIGVLAIGLSILFTGDFYYYSLNSRDCNIMQAEMTVTYAAMENSPRTFMEDVNVCRNVNNDNTYGDWYVDSIRK